MRIRTVILRTESFDYFQPKQHPFEIIHGFRQKDPVTLKETTPKILVKKHKNIGKNKVIKQKIHLRMQERRTLELHEDNQLKIMKDDSTRSLMTMESIKWICKQSGERASLFEDMFTGFEYSLEEKCSEQ